ncbi:Bifunctional dethiobiotin synthetase/7,8-diamino-pelargonic acid aminotransferase [Lachnellula suecica]|uniref:Bifunctional dethiobiotin synthetase/7,8-diamino-pelargonic acid aminotransferase n=1 Tax=Lachnellula suecica TaxID=602035 RepID=A0A8T9CCR7_9HELO|nr:Bifunctional dethiobiotin synthetase/7,8-diamino-pelargonic acid aminotransferase [Lachnellula suecica]
MASSLLRNLKPHQIYASNTSVGKTIFSTLLLRAHTHFQPSKKTFYLKPVSTGPDNEADDCHISRFSPATQTKCLYQFDEAVSPHIAARLSPLSDKTIIKDVQSHLASCAAEGGTLLLETAGGVHSPTPSGSSQADLYRPLRLPTCLVADHRLGGISGTISAFESLHIRGYDLDAVCIFQDETYQNYVYLREYFEKKGVKLLAVEQPPERSSKYSEKEDAQMMETYYGNVAESGELEDLVQLFANKHEQRIERLENMSTKAHSTIWYPFTQHREVSPDTILTIDSASGDFFQAHSKSEQTEAEVLKPTFDGSASWWTQGLGHGNPELSLAAAYAAGRYGHVMFAGTIHEPALKLAQNLLANLHNPRLAKCFFSDNGSTGMEVATKMALSASCERYGWEKGEIGVLGLKGSYHGDTIGAMDCSEPSVYNERVHWYEGRGFWFDFPQVKMNKGKWVVEPPSGMEGEFGELARFESLGDVFDLETRLKSPAGQQYGEYIRTTLERLVVKEKRKFGAVIMEPVILGAGGMLFADPLFQQTLIQVVRENASLFSSNTPKPSDPNTWSGLPIVFDEVFTGLYRLGRFSAASFLQTHPDISVHAKLLTGGLVPLCTTLASDSIYNAFLGSEKRDALLHGHSYTAHPVGCHVANTSLNTMLEMDREKKWQPFKDDWQEAVTGVNESVWSMWSKDFIYHVSNFDAVESVVALGSVLAISLQDANAGYSSSAATGLQRSLIKGSSEFKIHSRVLGNVFYMMASQTSQPETLRSIEQLLLRELP